MNVSKFFMSQKSKVVIEGLVTKRTSNKYSKGTYLLPIPKERITEASFNHSPAHVGNLCNSIDFYVPQGTKVFAAASGIVIDVLGNSRAKGNTTPYWALGNSIEIRHGNGECTHYEHLKYKGVKVNIGERVKAGDVIGLSGNTGFTEKPHLHFQVNKYGKKENARINKFRDKNDFVTLRARFSDFKDVYKRKRDAKL